MDNLKTAVISGLILNKYIYENEEAESSPIWTGTKMLGIGAAALLGSKIRKNSQQYHAQQADDLTKQEKRLRKERKDTPKDTEVGKLKRNELDSTSRSLQSRIDQHKQTVRDLNPQSPSAAFQSLKQKTAPVINTATNAVTFVKNKFK
jgi:hypothetical protein